MPRANRYIVEGHAYHLTHRCHDGAFLFRFAKDRQRYRQMLRKQLCEGTISLLNYTITSNHTHLLVLVREGGPEALSRFMQRLEGDFAQYYNIRAGRHGAFWSDRYHAVMIDRGNYTWACMKYIDLNMVRAGVVNHPEQWEWTGFRELMGLRSRNRLLDVDLLLKRLEIKDIECFRMNYRRSIEEAIENRNLRREDIWTEALGVGSQTYVKALGQQVRNRVAVAFQESNPGTNVWTVRETFNPHGLVFDWKKRSIPCGKGLYSYATH